MGAVPKNKITRVERGKRRSGNRPHLIKQNKKPVAIPLHKRGLVAQLKKALGLTDLESNQQLAKQPAKKSDKKSKK